MYLRTLFHHSAIRIVMLGLVTGCNTTIPVHNPVLSTQSLSQSAPAVSGLPNQSTSTAQPSFTPSPDVTSSPTQPVFDQAIYDGTLSAAQTRVAQFPSVCQEGYSHQNFSPDGLWMEELCYSAEDQDLILTLSNSENQVLWKLLYQDYLPPMDFIPDGGMSVVHWSNDGRYAYFNSFLGGDGGECFVSGWDSGAGLFRLDLQTGNVTTFLSPSDNLWWYGFSFSPTDRRLVYGARARDLKILDLATGQLISIIPKKDFREGGGYIWSPDGLEFVYSTVTSSDQGEMFSYSVRLVDAQSGSEQTLLESTNECLAVTLWSEDNVLTLEKNYGQAVIEFDLNSNKIVREATVTPYP